MKGGSCSRLIWWLGFAASLLRFTHAQFTAATFPDCTSGPLANNSVCDTGLDPFTRARALVGALTLAEKINQTGNTAPGVDRLGLPAYQWWQEALHGVVNWFGVTFTDSGNYSYATSFPIPILTGAAFDDDLVRSVATVISTEACAFSNNARAGLDYWTPNINPFSDPRWGRGAETPGEDPFHLSSYVLALIDGLQGGLDDPQYKRVVATCKHFAGYDVENSNGNFRYQFDAQISMQDLAEYYLPSFRSCARDAGVGSVMGSYNSVNGVPTCADPWLLGDVLRDHWNWTAAGYVVSDCDAVQNVYMPHGWAPTREGSVATALIAGTDIDCGTYYQTYLGGAHDQGLFDEAVLYQALVRVYATLVQLGYFDPAADQPYRSLDWSNVNTPEAQSLARRAASSGAVLLKNDGILPIDLSDKSVLVVGTAGNDTTLLQGSYYGTAPFLHTPLYGAQQVAKEVKYIGDPSVAFLNTLDSYYSWTGVPEMVADADVVFYVAGVSQDQEAESLDRVTLAWTYDQMDIIMRLASMGKPLVVIQMGGGQLDDAPLLANPNVSAVLWGGYPGQDGGPALFDVITGVVAPAGRLPVTQYPASFVAQVPMTDMTLRPSVSSPGRTYRWYNGTATLPFGHGLHYTNFSLETTGLEITSKSSSSSSSFAITDLLAACDATYLDNCPFATLPVTVQNTGAVTSEYVALAFLAGTFGPAPYPLKTLVAYARAHNLTAAGSTTLQLNLTLGSLGRVDDGGNMVLYPGEYELLVDLQPLVTVKFELTGESVVLDERPQKGESNRTATGVPFVPQDYFVGGFGSLS